MALSEVGATCICCEDLGSVPGYGTCPLCDGQGLSCHLPDPAAPPSEAPLPKPGQRNVLITAALPYVNNVPHLGNIIGSVLSADVYARYCRSRGYQTLFIGGTDEYGTATETKAVAEGVSPREICDKYHAIHKQIYKWFNISFDQFGRTSEPLQTEIVQGIFEKVHQGGWLEARSVEQLYSEGLQRFLADRFVEGTCPRCHYPDARGDQCDKCGSLLEPTDLIEPRCKVTGTKPVLRSTEHLYLNLPSLEEQVKEFVKTSSSQKEGCWSSNAVSVTASWLRDGLKHRCITRDLKWGVPVPLDGFREKVFYVWFDAPIGYVSITAACTSEWEQWWKSPKDVELVQFLGKDNIPFHTVIFPASLIATGDQWTLLKQISVTEYLNYEDGKFSKSRGVGVFGNDARNTEIPADVWRYYLLAVRPEQSDSQFRWSDLAAKNNNELLKNLGNYCHRVLDFLAARCGGCVPLPSDAAQEEVQELGSELKAAVASYVEHLEKARLREGLRVVLSVSSIGNTFLTRCEPWKRLKVDAESAHTHLAAAAGVVRLLAALLAPFLPTTAGLYLQYLGLDSDDGKLSEELLDGVANPHLLLPLGHQLGPRSKPVFQEITLKQVENFRQRFAGAQETATASSVSAGGA